MVSFDSLLKIAVENNCTAVRCVVDEPFSVQAKGDWIRLEMPRLTSEGVTELVKTLAPARQRQELAEIGRTEFDVVSSRGALFHVTICKQEDDFNVEAQRAFTGA